MKIKDLLMNQEQIRKLVKDELKTQILHEGLLHQAISRIGGGLVGGGLGTLVGITGFKGIITALASAGVIVSTNVLGAIGVGLAGLGLLGGAVVGGEMGERGAVKRDIKKINKILAKLDDVINARDEVLMRITHLKDEKELPRLDKEFQRLTQEQIKISKQLEPIVEQEYKAGTINAKAYHKITTELLPYTLEGKLSNLAL